LCEFLRFLDARQFLAEFHRVRHGFLGQRRHVLADGGGLSLEIFRHLARHLQEGVNGLSALIETLLCELPAPGRSEIGRLHRAFAALLNEICCISCHCLLPRRSVPIVFGVWNRSRRRLFQGNGFFRTLFLQLKK
jgi:hypothetical protein